MHILHVVEYLCLTPFTVTVYKRNSTSFHLSLSMLFDYEVHISWLVGIVRLEIFSNITRFCVFIVFVLFSL